MPLMPIITLSRFFAADASFRCHFAATPPHSAAAITTDADIDCYFRRRFAGLLLRRYATCDAALLYALRYCRHAAAVCLRQILMLLMPPLRLPYDTTLPITDAIDTAATLSTFADCFD